eukprot:s115_g15.t1
MADLGLELGLVVESDSSSAKAFASRVGLGKQRHVMTRYLWLQQVVQAERAVIKKIGTHHNPSDILTKASAAAVIEKHSAAMSLVVPASGEIEAGIDVPKLEELLKDYLFSKSIGTLNPPRFGAVLGAKQLREKHLCVLYSVECGPERPYEAAIGDEDETFEEVAYVTDYFSVSDAPPRESDTAERLK